MSAPACRCGSATCSTPGNHAWAYHIGGGPTSDDCATCQARHEDAAELAVAAARGGTVEPAGLCPAGLAAWRAVVPELRRLGFRP